MAQQDEPTETKPASKLDSETEKVGTGSPENADDLFKPFNKSAPRYMEGETIDGYRKRLATRLQQQAPSLKDVNVRDTRGSAFDLIEKQIYDEARREAVRPTMIPDGEMCELKRYDATGRPFIEWHGSPKTWLNDFANGAKRKLVGIRTETQTGYIEQVAHHA
jgi:hypothetical protein